MLACYLVKGMNLTAEQAIHDVRMQRPYSIETYEQEELVYQYHKYVQSSKQKFQ